MLKPCHRIGQIRLKPLPYPMTLRLETPLHTHHCKHRFHCHPRIPLPTPANQRIGRISRRPVKSSVRKHNHWPIVLLQQRMKGPARHIGGGTVPVANQSELVHDGAQLAADNPAMIRDAFASDLSGAASVPDGMAQLNAIAVGDAYQGGRGRNVPSRIVAYAGGGSGGCVPAIGGTGGRSCPGARDRKRAG